MNIVIAGGGITGWLSAFLLSKRYPHHKISIIDSSKISTIGVGEGTTGYFSSKLLKGEDFTVREFFEETKSTPKLGIEFNGWSSEDSSFFSPIDGSFTKLCNIDTTPYYEYWQRGTVGESSACGNLRRFDRIPFHRGFNDLSGVNCDFSWQDTAVHFDNESTIKFFKKKTLERRNVECIDTSILGVEKNKQGVKCILCEDDLKIYGDLFLDCTGFRRVLSKNVKWISYSKNLPTNSVITFEREHGEEKLDCVTKADAMNDGWVWTIPTQERYGCGYVYSDYFTNENKATEEVLSKYPDAKIGKSFKFDTGKQEKSWKDNVITLGLSYQFLEPLQATSIHCTLVQLDLLDRYCIKPTIGFTLDDNSREMYNSHIDRVIDNFRDFVNLHYTGKRSDTKFWKYISKGNHYSKFTKKILKLFKTRGIFYWDFSNEFGTTGQELWLYTLLGLNHLTKDQCFALLKNSGTFNDTASVYTEKYAYKHADKYQSYDDFIDRLNYNVLT